MPRAIALTADALLNVIRRFPTGASPEQLQAAFPAVSRPTLNRRLRALADDGRIEPKGNGPARVYLVAGRTALDIAHAAATDEVVPLSEPARRLRAYLRQALAQRTPVGYQRRFLDDYVPNGTYYLPPPLRRKLAELGKTEGARPAGTYVRQILGRLLIDLSWASSRLEGNTYSLLDTRRLIEEGARAEGKSAEEAIMILNHKRAIEFMVDNAAELGFSAMVVRNIHACLAEGLLADPAAVGRLRARAVLIEKSVYLPPQLPQLVEEGFAAFLERARAIADPFEQGFFAMAHLPYLQPFEDVNKRTSRLCVNIPLIRENLCPLSFMDVTERDYVDGLLGVYERTDVSILRDVYEWAYERSCARYKALRDSMGEPDPFRLRYRRNLAAAVRAVVVERQSVARALKAQALAAGDRARLRAIVLAELERLHEGSFARFGIRPGEYASWVAAGRVIA